MPKANLSIVVLATNEEATIAKTVGAILPLARAFLEDFEIILVDNGSTDATGSIVDRFAAREPRVCVIHNLDRKGIGFAFRAALAMAKFESITMVPDNQSFQIEGIARMFKAAAAADMVITYRQNRSALSLTRAIQSHLGRFILILIFGFWLADHHSMIIYPVKSLREISIKTDGYGYQICALISLLRLGLTYVQVPVSINTETKNSSNAVRLGDWLDLAKAIASLRPLVGVTSPTLDRRTRVSKILATKDCDRRE
jgi:dolichol-phosphate mannosyltransferase